MALMNHLIHDSLFESAARTPAAEALAYGDRRCSYAQLAAQVRAVAALLLRTGLEPGARVAVYMEKRIEIDPLITHVLPLERINEAFDLMQRGESIRSVVVY